EAARELSQTLGAISADSQILAVRRLSRRLLRLDDEAKARVAGIVDRFLRQNDPLLAHQVALHLARNQEAQAHQLLPPPKDRPGDRPTRLAYVEGLALTDKFDKARELALHLRGDESDRIEATLILIGVALAADNLKEARSSLKELLPPPEEKKKKLVLTPLQSL